jgi:hypothetical protein
MLVSAAPSLMPADEASNLTVCATKGASGAYGGLEGDVAGSLTKNYQTQILVPTYCESVSSPDRSVQRVKTSDIKLIKKAQGCTSYCGVCNARIKNSPEPPRLGAICKDTTLRSRSFISE